MTNNYIYNLNYQITDEDLCALEMRALFGFTPSNKVFLSDVKIKPSISAFLKNRIEILTIAGSYEELIEELNKNRISIDDFKVKYVEMSTKDEFARDRKQICREVALTFDGFHSYDNPQIYYGVTNYNNIWYFGILEKNDQLWKEHSKKPYSYSSSLNIIIAKSLVNIATKGDHSKSIIDPCCGVGTVLLEGMSAGYNIRGREINYKVAESARKNLMYYDYLPKVTTGDIEDITEHYDAAIIDLPYGISVKTTEDNTIKIIRNAKRISNRIILVSSVDIKDMIVEEMLKIIDYCVVYKNENRNFARYIWVLI